MLALLSNVRVFRTHVCTQTEMPLIERLCHKDHSVSLQPLGVINHGVENDVN